MARIAPGIDTPGRALATLAVGVGIEGAMVWRFDWSAPLLAFAYLAADGTVVAVNDLLTRRILNVVVGPSYPISLALLGLASTGEGDWWPLARAAIAMVALAGFYLILGLGFPAGMGLGDQKWAGILGCYLGWLGWAAVFAVTLLAFGVAALFVAATRIITRGRQSSLPFAPFMTAGALAAILAVR